MATAPLRFRCDRCGQLLGVAPARMGRTVRCPKCGASVLVPGPDAPDSAVPATTGGASPAGGPGPASAETPEAGAPGFFDKVELDPDDLRTLFPIELGEAPEAGGGRRDPGGIASQERKGPIIDEPMPSGVQSGHPDRAEWPSLGIEGPGEPLPEVIGAFLAAPPDESPPPGESQALATSARSRVKTSRDVAIPRVALIAWSLFVLVALFLAFVAGLVVGHFVWKVPA